MSIVAPIGLLLPVPAPAQHWFFQMYGPDQGLTNPTVLALRQDREGFLWASTEGGLFRYDGDRFRPSGINSASRGGNSNSMHSSADGQFWTGSSRGLFRWNGQSFAAVPGFAGDDLESGEAIGSDAANLYVASPRGLHALALRGGHAARQVSSRPSYSVFVASDRTVWFSSGSLLCSLQDGREQVWDSARGVTGGPWQSIAEDSGGRLWIRSAEKVLVRAAHSEVFHGVPGLPKLDSTHGAPLVAIRLGQMVIPHNYLRLRRKARRTTSFCSTPWRPPARRPRSSGQSA